MARRNTRPRFASRLALVPRRADGSLWFVRRSVLAVALTAIALSAACASLVGLSGGSATEASEGGVDGGLGAETAPSDPCAHAAPPPPPDTDDDPTGQISPVFMTVREFIITGGGDAGPARGFDLDGVCTCSKAPGTAMGGAASCVPPDGGAVVCDEDNGVDRQLSAISEGYPQVLRGVSPDVGGPSLLLRITGYNGRANDKQVFVAIYPSVGIRDKSGCGSPDAGGPPYAPTWTGCDKWTVRSAYVLPASGTEEPLLLLPAYVNQYRLVLSRSAKTVPLVGNGALLPLSGATLTGKLVPVGADMQPVVPRPAVGALFRLEEGLIGGRASTVDMLRAFAEGQAAADGGPLCGSFPFFETLKATFLCPNVDLMAKPSDDFTNQTCNAISFSVGFYAQPAMMGAIADPAPLRCGDSHDPSHDALYDCTK